MKKTLPIVIGLLASVPALADTHLAGIKTHAANVERDSTQTAQMLKAKQPDKQAVRAQIEKTGLDITALQKLVADFEATSPQFSEQNKKDWQDLKEKVQLLSIFYNVKQELATSDDMQKNRSLLRAHAKGLSERAAKLQETANRLTP
jgi:predicted  nucleic acid-binding Zn-ribbon protein